MVIAQGNTLRKSGGAKMDAKLIQFFRGPRSALRYLACCEPASAVFPELDAGAPFVGPDVGFR
jgi:hypothetical protein